MWNAQGENFMDGIFIVIYPEWVCQSAIKTVYFLIRM